MTHERVVHCRNGWLMLGVNLALLLSAVGAFVGTIVLTKQVSPQAAWLLVPVIPFAVFAVVMLCGHFPQEPNEGRALLLAGAYHGTVRESGFWWANPLLTRRRVSLRSRNLETQKLKVNDKRGNPIEIGAVVVWRVQDTAQALFDVENYEQFVHVQSESALRHLANIYAYDHGEEGEITLRSGVEEVSAALQQELQQRLAQAGVVVEEARLTHLAYASEIAGAMLRRQQAEAVIAARKMIVHGAVSMVQMALEELSEKQVVELDAERKANMVSNLLVVLCGEAEVTPVVNTGSGSASGHGRG